MSKSNKDLISELEYRPLDSRKLTQSTCLKYGYGIGKFGDGMVQVAPFFDRSGRVVAQKVRLPNKDFRVLGNLKEATLFGQRLVREGGKMLVITEGEIDAMSVCQAMGGSWPAVSVPNGAAGAAKAVREQLDFLETQEKIVICFDNDEAGRKATSEVVELFSPGKAAIAHLGGYKDANEMLQDGKTKELRDAIWSAQTWRPDGIVNLKDLKARIRAPLAMGMSYPWEELNTKLYGFRPQELITITAGTGVGKTAVVSEILHHLIKDEVKTGIIYLEEGVDRAGKRVVGIELNKPLHLPGHEVSDEEFDRAWANTLETGLVEAYDHFGSLEEDRLLNRVRYMVRGLGCRVVILDHISLVVSGQDLDKDERRTLDHIMTNLRSLTQETGAAIFVVSHLRRPPGAKNHEEGGQVSLSHLRGTQAIAQLSDAVIALERNQQAADEEQRNTTEVRVLKNRYSGTTGPAGKLFWSQDTGRLVDRWSQKEDDSDF